MSTIHTTTDAEFEALVEARCWKIRPSGFHPQAWRECVAEQIRKEREATNWVPASAELIRQCSTDGALR